MRPRVDRRRESCAKTKRMIGRQEVLATLLSGLVVLLTASLSVAEESGPGEAGTLQLEKRSYKVGGETIEADFGLLTVPENRSRADSRMIQIAYVRLPGAEGSDGPPLVYLEGGPGQSVIQTLSRRGALRRWTPLMANGDVILLDQRGVGFSRPNLGFLWKGDTPVNLFRSLEDARPALEGQARIAADHFKGRGVDLSGYTSVESADDVNDLRIALGADKINLFGFSYGTHLGLAVIRRHGEHVENAVLMGVEGPNHTYKLPSTMDSQFAKLAMLAEADPAIAEKIPDLNTLLDRVLDKLEREPMMVTVRDPGSGDDIEIPIGADGLISILRRDIGDASDLPVFPRLLYSIDQGDSSVLEWFARKRFRLGTHAMSAVMDAASGATPSRLAQIETESKRSRFKIAANFPYPEIGEVWNGPDLGEEFRSPLISDTRTLFLSGTLDFNTPPFQAEEVRWGFSNSSHIIVENAGHEQIIQHPNVQRAIGRFLAGESVDDVTASFPPLSFVPLEGRRAKLGHPSVR